MVNYIIACGTDISVDYMVGAWAGQRIRFASDIALDAAKLAGNGADPLATLVVSKRHTRPCCSRCFNEKLLVDVNCQWPPPFGVMKWRIFNPQQLARM